MKTLRFLAILFAATFVTRVVAADEAKPAPTEAKPAKCCAAAEKDGKECTHGCCVEAATAGKNCEKCGGSGAAAKKK